MATLSVKVPTAKVIEMLENKIASLKSEVATYPARKAEYVQAKADYSKSLVSLAIDALTNRSDLISDEHSSPIYVGLGYGGDKIQVSFDSDALGFPKPPVEPKNPNERQYVGRDYASLLEILENTLKTLRLTEQETINASTYANVLKFL